MSGAWSLPGRVVLVTGAARGIGLESSRLLAARGARVALVGLEPELLEQRAAELGPDAAWFAADVTDRAQLDAAVAGTVARFGGLDVVVANAGVAVSGPVATIDPDLFERLIDVNLLGVWRTVRAALPHVVARQGYVLPIASLAAALHSPMISAYNASKAGVEAFTNSLRVEVAPSGTAVGCAYFSFIDTDMVRRSFDDAAARRVRERAGALMRPAPLADAALAVVEGIERRRRIVVAPGWVRGALVLRTVLQPLSERVARRRAGELAEAMRAATEEPAALTTAQP